MTGPGLLSRVFHRASKRISQPNRRDGASGMTLIEALAAFIIATAALLAVFEGFQAASGVQERTKRIASAIVAAQSAVDRLGVDIPVQSGARRWREGRIELQVTLTPSDQRRALDGDALLFDALIEAQHLDGGAPVSLRTLAISAAEGAE